jgi:hypothetical protein
LNLKISSADVIFGIKVKNREAGNGSDNYVRRYNASYNIVGDNKKAEA